jgi:hypothetical protein
MVIGRKRIDALSNMSHKELPGDDGELGYTFSPVGKITEDVLQKAR